MQLATEFKTLIKIPGGAEGQRCFYPVRLDPYGKGCQHNCSYCYARGLLDFRKLWDSNEPAAVDIKKVRHIFTQVFDKGSTRNKFSSVLTNKVPLRLGGMTDPLMPFEEECGNTYELLKILKEYEYPYLLLTKSSLIGTEKYLDVLDKNLAVLQVSVNSLNEDMSAKIEMGASSPKERLWAIQQLAEHDFYVTARISPLIPIYPDGHYAAGGKDSGGKRFDYFSWELVHEICKHKASSVLVEFMRFVNFSHQWLGEDVGDDLRWMKTDSSYHKGGAVHYSKEEKRYYFERVRAICNEYSTEFSVCDDAEFEYFKEFWSNQSDCCNANGKVKGFQNTIKSAEI